MNKSIDNSKSLVTGGVFTSQKSALLNTALPSLLKHHSGKKVSHEEEKNGHSTNRNFLIQIPNLEKKKSNAAQYSFNDIILNSDGKIDTSKWVNQANIVTPNFKKSTDLVPMKSLEKSQYFLKYANTCNPKSAY